MLDFWLRVKDKLDFQDSTQRNLAQNINESYNTLQSWINRDRLPNAEQAVRIAEALNTSVEFLVTGKSNNRKNDHSKTVKLTPVQLKYSNKSGVTFYDSELPTAYYIFSKYITNSKEYSKTVDACKEFFDVSMNLIYLADMKDICDIAPCCELEDYSVKQFENGEKYIYIEYNCEDLELLFKIASMYNAKGRVYVLEKYAE